MEYVFLFFKNWRLRFNFLFIRPMGKNKKYPGLNEYMIHLFCLHNFKNAYYFGFHSYYRFGVEYYYYDGPLYSYKFGFLFVNKCWFDSIFCEKIEDVNAMKEKNNE